MHAWDVNSENSLFYLPEKHCLFRAFTILVVWRHKVGVNLVSNGSISCIKKAIGSTHYIVERAA